MELQKFYSMIEFMNAEKVFVNDEAEVGSIVLIQQPEVIYESEDCCNVDYCKENNIVCFHEKYMRASCVVMDKGNIILGIKRQNINGKCLISVFSKAFVDFLKSKNLNVTTDKNDILIDGYKVASGTESEFIKYAHRYMGYQISLNQNMNFHYLKDHLTNHLPWT